MTDHRPVRRRIRPLAAMLTGLSGAAATLVAGPATVVSAAACPDVEVLFARGTSEPVGIGRVGQALTAALQAQLPGRVVTSYAVNYPATYDFPAAATGATDATARVAAMTTQCPSTALVLGGYSQGAAVVDMLVGLPPLGDRIGSIGSAPPLPASLARNVAALAVFGNPAAKFGNPVSAAPAPFTGRGIDVCSDGDPICSDGRNPFAHTRYEKGEGIAAAAAFVAARV